MPTGSTTRGMQTIAREFGHPETVFVLKPEAGGTARVRVFTPAVELPFAGHPTVGTALILALKGHGDAGKETRARSCSKRRSASFAAP